MERSQLDLSGYRIEKSADDLDSAEILFKNGQYSQSINRSYYAMFHAIRSLLALDKFDSKKHSGVIAYFNLHYVKTEKIEPEYSKIISSASRFRNKSDYNDFFIADKDEAQVQIEDAYKFLARIKNYLKSNHQEP